MVDSEAARLHVFHCDGCSEYGGHGGERTPPPIEDQLRKAGRTVAAALEAYEKVFGVRPTTYGNMLGHEHNEQCYDC